MGHAQKGIFLLRESGDSPRIRQTEGKSTAQDFWNSIQDSFLCPPLPLCLPIRRDTGEGANPVCCNFTDEHFNLSSERQF